jgi:hypothetical protein
VIQWRKSWIPPNPLAYLYRIATEIAERHALRPEVTIDSRAYDPGP